MQRLMNHEFNDDEMWIKADLHHFSSNHIDFWNKDEHLE